MRPEKRYRVVKREDATGQLHYDVIEYESYYVPDASPDPTCGYDTLEERRMDLE